MASALTVTYILGAHDMDLSVIITSSADEPFRAIEAFDLSIAGAVFDWETSLFFVGSGLSHCYFRAPIEGSDDLNKRWLSATLFGLDRLYRLDDDEWPVDIELAPIADHVQTISRAKMQDILASSRRVMVI